MLVSGWLQSHPVALRCTLIQTGDEQVQTRSTSVLSFQETTSTQSVVQVHIYKNEAGDKWAVLSAAGINAFLRQLGFALDSIAQTWSQAFFSKGKKSNPPDAEYFHGFIKIEKNKVEALLKLGGMSGFYPNPRSVSKGPDTRFRSILLRGHTLQEARSVQATLSSSFGLTRSKHGLGVRVLSVDYKALKNNERLRRWRSKEISTSRCSRGLHSFHVETSSPGTGLTSEGSSLGRHSSMDSQQFCCTSDSLLSNQGLCCFDH